MTPIFTFDNFVMSLISFPSYWNEVKTFSVKIYIKIPFDRLCIGNTVEGNSVLIDNTIDQTIHT